MKTSETTANRGGRPRKEADPQLVAEQMRLYRAGKTNLDAAAAACGLSRTTFFQRLREAPKTSFADAMKPVSDSDTGQLRLIPVDEIDPDPLNFYSLDGIDQLAGNIEMIGLQQPLRVRALGERYEIISGHRRREAILMIRESDPQAFRDGVPCIVERGEDSPAMRELKLIYANSATRVMTSAEISRQAERVTALLYQLQAEGVAFPGRMREHVAEACRISEAKLGRLNAIRKNLHTGFLAAFDRGELPEETAYQLSRLPEEIQAAAAEELSSWRRKKLPTGSVVAAVNRKLAALQAPMTCRAHAGGPECHHATGRVVRSLFAPYDWHICDSGKCCMDCYQAQQGCSGACREARDRAKLNKAVEAEKKSEQDRIREREFEDRRRQIIRISKGLLPLAEAAGLDDGEKLFDYFQAPTMAELRKWAAGDTGDKTFYSVECVRPTRAGDIKTMAQRLHISADRVLGIETDTSSGASVPPPPEGEGNHVSESDTKKPGGGNVSESDTASPVWRTGTPEDTGWYVTWSSYHAWDPDFEILWWDSEIWKDTPASAHESESLILAWFRMPAPPKVKARENEETVSDSDTGEES